MTPDSVPAHPMRALILKPQRLADPGLVGEALAERGIELVEHILADEGPPPPLDGFDLLVVMGSPWSVYGEEVRGWIDGLLERIREADDAQIPMLGICFGAQAFAQAMGGAVEKAPDTEVGLRQVYTGNEAIVSAGPWFMWHGDTFVPPPTADVIARTPAGPQAYRSGAHLLVQFHPEATADIVEAWLAFDDSDFRTAGVDPLQILAAMRGSHAEAKARADRLVGAFLQGRSR